ncbi:hypothetical protein [Streptomyces formicae]
MQEKTDLAYYPFHGLPGRLRDDLELDYRDLTRKPVLALLMPDGREEGTPWHGLRGRVWGDLGSYERSALLRVRLTDRAPAWPPPGGNAPPPDGGSRGDDRAAPSATRFAPAPEDRSVSWPPLLDPRGWGRKAKRFSASASGEHRNRPRPGRDDG